MFKTGNVDTSNRLTIEQVVNQIQHKQKPERLTVTEFDKRIASAILKRRQAKLTVTDSNK